MDYLIYTAIGITVIFFIIKYLIKLSVSLINLIWDGYRIYILTGDEEAKITIEIGLATVSKDHRQLLIDSILKDINQEQLFLHLSKQELPDELKNKIHSFAKEVEISDDLYKEKLARIADTKLIINKFKEFDGNINESIVLKKRHKERYPHLISAFIISNRQYFRLKNPSFNEPNLTERIEMWKKVS
jgi:hypothetical protein